jgi:hypothetical protein
MGYLLNLWCVFFPLFSFFSSSKSLKNGATDEIQTSISSTPKHEKGEEGRERGRAKNEKKVNSLGILDLLTSHSSLFFQNPDLLRKLVDSEPTHSTQKHSKLLVD